METETSDAAVPLERNKAGMFTGVGKLSWPLILAYLGQDLLRIIDHVMLGNYDPTVLAGVGIAGGVMWMHFAIGIGLAGLAFAGLARVVVWSARCPGCQVPFKQLPSGFRRFWEDATCEACGLSLFELRRSSGLD